MLNNFCSSITQLDLFAPVLDWHLENFHWDNAGLENPSISLVRYNVEVVLLVDHVYLLLIDLQMIALPGCSSQRLKSYSFSVY